ncbi:MAG: hypothetical protein FJ184_00845 [Gammaproteobacteria bacterium]|nr:hypothetical protein [Gammaproteobacteria bacterium]
MRNSILFTLTMLVLTGCTAAGVKDIEYAEFEKTRTINKGFDEVWGYILEWSAVNSFPIESTDKTDGVIKLTGSGTVSRSFLLSGPGAAIDQQLVSCGKATGNIGLYKAKFTDLTVNATIILRDTKPTTRVTVNMSGNVGVEVSNAYGVVSESRSTCLSKGIFEKKFFDDLSAL